MDTILIPTEADFRRWIKDAIKECLEQIQKPSVSNSDNSEPLLTRKEIAGIFGISIVTLHAWVRNGLPKLKQGGRVYFLRSDVIAYIKQKRGIIIDPLSVRIPKYLIEAQHADSANKAGL